MGPTPDDQDSFSGSQAGTLNGVCPDAQSFD